MSHRCDSKRFEIVATPYDQAETGAAQRRVSSANKAVVEVLQWLQPFFDRVGAGSVVVQYDFDGEFTERPLAGQSLTNLRENVKSAVKPFSVVEAKLTASTTRSISFNLRSVMVNRGGAESPAQ